MMFAVFVRTPNSDHVDILGPFMTEAGAKACIAALESHDYQRGDHLYSVERIKDPKEFLS